MKIQLKRSNQLENGSAKEPSVAQMEYGELAVNYNTADPSLFIKDSADQIVKLRISEGAQVLISDTIPSTTENEPGTLWWNSSADSGQLFILYDDPANGGGVDPGGPKWIEASPTTGGPDADGAKVLVSDTAPVVDDLEEGSLWWNSSSEDLQLYVLYDENGDKKWIEASPMPSQSEVSGYPDTGDGNGATLDARYVQTQPAGGASQNVAGNLTLGTDKITLDASGSAEFKGKLFGGLHNSNHPGEASLNISGANNTKFIQLYDRVNVKNNSFTYDNGFLSYDGSVNVMPGEYQGRFEVGTTIGQDPTTASATAGVRLWRGSITSYCDTEYGGPNINTGDFFLRGYSSLGGAAKSIKTTLWSDGSAEFNGDITTNSNNGIKLHGTGTNTQFYSIGKDGAGGTLQIKRADTVLMSMAFNGNTTFAGTITTQGGAGGPYVTIGQTITFNTAPDDPTNYTTTTDADGNETQVYNGPTLDVKERLQNLISRLDSLESDEITDDATSTLLLTTVNNLNAQMTKVNNALTAIRAAANAAGTLDQLKTDIAAATADI